MGGDTSLVMRGGTVLDTVIGGNSGGSSGDGNTVTSTWIYFLGNARLLGDNYEEAQIGTPLSGYALTESTIMTGGSNNGKVAGDTHVFISGDAQVWDVQGGGRRGTSEVTGTASVDISGNAWVKHAACGSITDGMFGGSWTNKRCVINTSISVSDDAKVGSIFGAGYDTYYDPLCSSMYGPESEGDPESTISINVSGGTVGYIYGGGYRGTVGAEWDETNAEWIPNPLESITITISGGMIVGDVFGGGRGGVDKILHGTDGSFQGSAAYNNSTGTSHVYADRVYIKMTGGMVAGNIYGGGESVPKISDYGGVVDDYIHGGAVARMECTDLEIDVSGGHVQGDVFGGGKGIGNGAEGFKAPSIDVIDKDGKIKHIPWFLENGEEPDASYFTGAELYRDFATVHADSVKVGISNGDQGTDYGVANVYGGGEYATTQGATDDKRVDIHIELKGAVIGDCVFGGGRGDVSDSAAGYVTASNVYLDILGTEVGRSGLPYAVFGGGAYAVSDVSEDTIIRLGAYSGKYSSIYGDVHGGGFGGNPRDSSMPSATYMVMNGDRTVAINKAFVYGNLYGGSRLGMDGSPTSQNESTILIADGLVTRNVYGGGFQGTSYMDSTILIGNDAHVAPAWDDTDTVEYGARTGSIFSGGNIIAETITTDSTPVLLHGNATISIGGTGYDPTDDSYDPSSNTSIPADVRGITINGSIFGSGNFTTISGSSVVNIENLQLTGDYSITSIQNADEVNIMGSELDLIGSADSKVSGASILVSLNRIAELNLFGGTKLDLFHENFSIGGLSSYTSSGTLASKEYYESDLDSTGFLGNELVIHAGGTLSILGPNNDGVGASPIEGFTLLSTPETLHYGAYAYGSKETDDQTGGFLVRTSSGCQPASTIMFQAYKMWYISGHVGLDTVVDLKDDSDPSKAWIHTTTVRIPNVRQDSYITYGGMILRPVVADGLYLAEKYGTAEDDFNSYVTGYVERSGDTPDLDESIGNSMFLNMNLGYMVIDENGQSQREDYSVMSHDLDTEDYSWVRVDDGSNPLNMPIKGSTEITTSLASKDYYGNYLKSDGTYGTLGNSGFIGSVTLIMLEVVPHGNDYVIVNTVDLNIDFYVGSKKNASAIQSHYDIRASIVVVNGKRSTTYVNLPSQTRHQTYYIFSEGYVPSGSVILSPDYSSLGFSGWTEVDDDSVEYDSTHNLESPVRMGSGGIKVTSIMVDYIPPSAGTIDNTFEFWVYSTPYNGNFIPPKVDPSDTTERAGTYYHIIVSIVEAEYVNLNLEYSTLADDQGNEGTYHLNAETDGQSYWLSWTNETTYKPLPLILGGTLQDTEYEFRFESDGVAETMSVYEAMDVLLTMIPDGTISGMEGSFDYAEHHSGWYIGETTSEFYPTFTVNENLTLRADFGIRVTFDGRGVSVTPSFDYIKPGTSASDKYRDLIGDDTGENKIKVWDGTLLTGYHIDKGWQSENAYKFTDNLYEDTTFYIEWIPNTYLLKQTINGTTLTESTVTFGDDVSITVSYGNVKSYTAEYSTTDQSSQTLTLQNVSGIGTDTFGFTVPYAGYYPGIVEGKDVQGVIILDLTTVTGSTVTVTFDPERGNALDENGTTEITVRSVDADGNEVTSIILSEIHTTDHLVYDTTLRMMVSFETTETNWHWSADGTMMNPIGDASVEVTVPNSGTVEFSLFRGVNLKSTPLPEGVEEIGSSRGSELQFKGDTITVTAKTDYIFPAMYLPSGTSQGEMGDTYRRYTVLGTEDVVIEGLTNTKLKFTVNSTFDFNGATISEHQNVTLHMTLGSLSYGGSVIDESVTIDLDPNKTDPYTTTFDVGYTTENQRISFHVDGYSGGYVGTVVPIENKMYDAEFTLNLYTVTYVENGKTHPDDTWHIHDSSQLEVPGSETSVNEDGNQLWAIEGPDGTVLKIITDLSPELFGNGLDLVLHAVPVPQIFIPTYTEFAVIGTVSEFSEGKVLYDVDSVMVGTHVVSSGDWGLSVTISDEDGSLVMRIIATDGTGSSTSFDTGMFVVISGDHRMTVHVVADPTQLEGATA